MNHRERLLTTLAHREPDRVPLDLGAGIACSINAHAFARLKEHLGFDTPTKVNARFSQSAAMEENVLRRFDIDVRGLRPGFTTGTQPPAWEDTWPGEADEWGIVWAKAPFGQPYEIDAPLYHGEPTVQDLKRYPWPDPTSPKLVAGLREQAEAVRRDTDYALVLALAFYPFTQSHLLRGHANWLMDLAADRPFAEALLDHVTDVLADMTTHILREVGDLVDVVCWGDDVSIQTGPMLRPDLFREVVKPRYRRMMDAIKGGTDARVFFHTCGSVHWLVPDLIDIGVDILNPIQATAANMDTRQLKKDYGRDIIFWGGGCDSQRVLPFATPAEVRDEVRRRIDDLAPGGGFVFAPIHNIQGEVPPENVVAMYDAALEFGRYG